MFSLSRLRAYLSPLEHLGERTYSTLVPVCVVFGITVVFELIGRVFLSDSQAFGTYAITLYLALVIFFAFRFGRRGGISTVFLTVIYYLYIIYSREYSGAELANALLSTFIIGGLYFIIAYIIGWLKERIDTLIEREVNAHARLAAIIRQLPVGVLIADTSGTVIDSNTRMRKIVGGKLPLGSPVGRSLHRLLYPETGILVSDKDYPIHRALRQHDVINNEYSVVQKEGSRIPVLVSASPIINKRGNVVAAVAIYQDITTQRELEKRKDDFVTMASHELKTPITSMSLYLGILKQKVKERNHKVVAKAVDNVEKQISNLTDVITNLLDVSRYQTGKMTYSNEAFYVDELIRDVVDALAGTSTGHRLIITRDIHVQVHGDRYRIYQVLSNLITNAFKYSPEGTDVTVTAVREKKFVRVSVKDKGVGIQKSQQRKIFTKLYQVSEPAIDTYPGFGMGLYIAKEIIKHHKGKIGVESILGKGSTFYFTLPLE